MAACDDQVLSSNTFIVVHFFVVEIEAGRKPLTFTAEMKDFLQADDPF